MAAVDYLEFAEARLAEDKAIAEAAGGSAPQGTWAQVDPDRRPGRIDCDSGYVVTYDEGSPDEGQAPHIARHDPARALREAEAGLRILERHRDCLPWSNGPCEHAGITGEPPCPDMRDLLVRWDDHADYNPGWHP